MRCCITIKIQPLPFTNEISQKITHKKWTRAEKRIKKKKIKTKKSNNTYGR